MVFFKYVRQTAFRDADATIPNLDTDLVAGASATQQYPSPIGVPNRIRQQIAQHLLQHALVATDDEIGLHDVPLQALLLDRAEKIRCDRIEDVVDGKVAHA